MADQLVRHMMFGVSNAAILLQESDVSLMMKIR
jgi:hypothetical protein